MINGFNLQRWSDTNSDSGPRIDTEFSDLDADSGDTRLHVDTGLGPGETYYYRIMINGSPNNSGISAVVSATTVADVPDRPDNVQAAADGETAIDITWDVPEDNGSPIDHYHIEVWNSATRMWAHAMSTACAPRTGHPPTTVWVRGRR